MDNKELLGKYKIPELKQILKERKLKISGKKDELIERILNNPKKIEIFNFPILNLPLDVLREIALNLPLLDIFKLCQTNKRFKLISNDKIFWEKLFLREIDEKIEIPENVTIEWYKEKIRYWPSVKYLASLIIVELVGWHSRSWMQRKIHPTFIQPLNGNWNSFEIIENLATLDCRSLKLTCLPPMPNMFDLWCMNNRLTSLPPMPKLERLNCIGNNITIMPSYPNLRELNCQDNQLASLPELPNLRKLYCGNNKLTSLPDYPKLTKLYCKGNNLPFSTLKQWQKWKNKKN